MIIDWCCQIIRHIQTVFGFIMQTKLSTVSILKISYTVNLPIWLMYKSEWNQEISAYRLYMFTLGTTTNALTCCECLVINKKKASFTQDWWLDHGTKIVRLFRLTAMLIINEQKWHAKIRRGGIEPPTLWYLLISTVRCSTIELPSESINFIEHLLFRKPKS